MNIKQIKEELRKEISKEIAALPDSYISASNSGLLRHVIIMKEFVAARNIFIYFSVEREPDTRELIKTAFSMGKTVALPYCYRKGIMEARVVGSLDELHPAILGIPAPPDTAPVIAPEELDLIIVPALAFDAQHYRLGYGGGYYDRYLQNIPAYTVGLTRALLIKDKLPRETHDIAVDCVITESGIPKGE